MTDETYNDDMDIEAALASVSSLSDVIAEQEAAEAAEVAKQEVEHREREEAQQRREAYYFPRPPAVDLIRGQLASVVPALVLIAIGAWLTFTLATDGPAPSLPVITLVGMAGLGVTLLSYWLSSGRWSYGALFGGLVLLALAGAVFYMSQSLGVGSWPLLVSAVGAAMLLSGLLGRATGRGLLLVAGLALVLAGIGAMLLLDGAFGPEITDAIQQFGGIIVAVVAVLLLVPVLLRRRQ